MSQIAILGMGAMGSRMAKNLLQQGYDVIVWNRLHEKVLPLLALGATSAKTPKVAAGTADFVISMLRDDEASRQVWLGKDGALAGMKADAIAIESSTLTVSWTCTLAKACQDQGISFLDAPVAGSLPQAEAAQLIYLVGGSSEALTSAQPILDTLGGAVHHVGEAGNGMAIKLAVNTLLAVQSAAIAELIGVLQQCGLAGERAVSILTATPVCSPAVKGLSAAMVARQFAPMFPIELVEKDLGYLMATAHEKGALAPMAQAAQQIFETAIAQGKGADNITGIAQLYF